MTAFLQLAAQLDQGASGLPITVLQMRVAGPEDTLMMSCYIELGAWCCGPTKRLGEQRAFYALLVFD
jgi:hypothetical protein